MSGGLRRSVDASRTLPLSGRTTELAAIVAAIERAGAGRAEIVFVAGEAGIGKSRLVAEAIELAEERGFSVLRARCEELERNRPFGALTDAFVCRRSSADPARAEIAGLLDTGVAADPADRDQSDYGLQHRIVERFVDLVEKTAADTPVVVALEDLHWADSSTLLAIRSIARRLLYSPLVLLLNLRPSPRSHELEQLVEASRAEGATFFDLDPLSADEVAQLCVRHIGAPPGPHLREQIARTAGNPLFVIELLKALTEEGLIQIDGGVADVREASIPPTLRLTILRRLSFLSPQCTATLRMASILGAAFSVSDLAVLLERSPIQLDADVEEALRSGVVEEDGDALRFRHDLIREAVYMDISASARTALHREAAAKLEASGAPLLRVAEHVSLGAAAGDRDAALVLVRAAREVMGLSAPAALGLLNRAAELLDGSDPLRDEIEVERVRPLLWTGRAEEAGSLATRLLQRPREPTVELSLRRWLREAARITGDLEASMAQYKEMASIPGLTEWERASHSNDPDDPRHAEKIEEAIAFARRVGNATGVIQGLSLLAERNFIGVYRLPEALALAEEAEKEARSTLGQPLLHADPPAYDLGFALQVRGFILMHADRPAEAAHVLEDARRVCRETGAVLYLPVFGHFVAGNLFLRGEWDDALAETETEAEIEDPSGQATIGNLGLRALVAVHRGDLDAATSFVASALEVIARNPTVERLVTTSLWFWAARAALQEATGESRAALETLHNAQDICRGYVPTLTAEVVRLAVAHGERKWALGHIEWVEACVPRAQTATMSGVALHARGLYEADPDILLASAKAYEESPRPLQRAAACVDAAVALGGRGRASEATPLFEKALDFYELVGATRDIARVSAAMRELGIRRGARGRRQRPTVGWESLTKSEMDVVRFVATGLRNADVADRLFISPRTVQTHLSHVFAKLGISSRAELVAEATRRSGASPALRS